MYNYKTATYYLLAERVLSAYRLEQANQLILNSVNSLEKNDDREK